MARRVGMWVLVLAGCGGGLAPAPTAVNVAAPTAKRPSAPAPVRPPAALGLPRGAPLAASVDVSSALSAVGPLRGELESELGLPPGALSHLGALGIDEHRPVAIALAPLSAAESRLVDDLGRIAAGKPNDETAARAVERVHPVAGAALRILIPATDPRRLETSVVKTLRAQGWRPVRWLPSSSPAPVPFVRSDLALEVVLGRDAVAVDVAVAHHPARALAPLQQIMSNARDAAPELRGQSARITWSPAAFARSGFFFELDEVSRALSGVSLTPAQRVRLEAESLREAAGTLSLPGDARGAWFDRIDLSIGAAPLELELRAKPGPAFTLPPDAAWAPSTSVDVGDAFIVAQGSRAFLTAWKAFDAKRLFPTVRRAGWAGWFVALPSLLVDAPFALPRAAGQAAAPPEVAARFERMGEAWDAGGPSVFVGLLPATASRSKAECALASGRCDASSRLTLGKVVKRGHLFAKLVRVGRRFVVLASDDGLWLPKRVTTSRAGPLHLEMSTAPLAAKLGMKLGLPDRIVGDVTRDGSDVVFRFKAP